MFFKVLHNLVPSYLCNNPLPKVSTLSPYNLRNANNIRPLRARTNLYKTSFFPSTTVAWNNLSDEVKSSLTRAAFQTSIRPLFLAPKAPAYYNMGERLPAIWHTRLRTGHSTLNSHAFAHGISCSNLCFCGQKEDLNHYFFECPNYAAPRVELLTSIAKQIAPGVHFSLLLTLDKKYLLKMFLQGSPDLSQAENTLLFHTVQSYIKRTKRFEHVFQF